jgi:DNA primase
MALSWEDLIQEVKQRIDVLDVVSEYVKLRPAGRRHVGLCPFHSEKTGSFYVTPDTGSWHCFGCGEGGDVIKFVQRIENLSFAETMDRLARRVGLQLPEKGGDGQASSERERYRALHELACQFYEKALAQTPEAKEYLKERGISPEIAKTFRLGFAPDSFEALRSALRREKASDDDLVKAGLLKRKPGETKGGYDFFRDRLMFPIADQEGRIIGFGGRLLQEREGQGKYINSPETPTFVKNRVLYGLNRALKPIKDRREALVMEGYMDVIAAHEFGFNNAVAPLGTALTENHLQILKRHCDRVYLVFDADGAGMRAALRSLALFEKSELEARVVALPAGEDPDSLLRKRGTAPFAQALSDALPILDYRMAAILSHYDVRTDSGFTQAFREIAPLLSQVTAADSWLHRLAELRSNGAPERVAFIEEDLRRRVRQYRAGQNSAPEPFRKETEGEGNRAEPAPISSTLRKLYLAEEEVLRACLADSESAAHLRDKMGFDAFLRPEAKELATVITSHLEDEEWSPHGWVIESETARSLFARLSADPRQSDIEEAVRVLIEHKEREGIKPLTEGRTPTVEEWKRIQELYLRRQQTGTG